MSLASETRQAVDEHPFLVTALRAGIVNFTACARFLPIDGETDAVATALRRYAEELPAFETETLSGDVRVTMQSGVGSGSDSSEPILAIGGATLDSGGGDLTAILATGAVDATALSVIIDTLESDGITVQYAGAGDDTIVVIVDRLEGADAVRTVERALERVPV